MKSIVVIYIPFEFKPKKKFGTKKMKREWESAGFKTLVIIDPAREKVEVEVFFNN